MSKEEQVTDETENFLVSTSDAPKVEEPKEETQEPRAAIDAEDDSAESMEEDTSKEEADDTKQKPKKSRAQRRIESLNAEKNKAFEKIAELEAKLEQKSEPKQSEEIDPADYDTYEEYEAAIEAAKAKPVIKPKDTPVVNADFVLAREELLSKFDEEADRYEDFDEKTQNQDLKITDHMVMAFNELDNAVDTVYYFASNPAEAMKVSGMTAAKQAIYVVKKSLELKKTPKKKVTNAPEPIETVGGSGEYTKPDNELSFKEFEERRNAQTQKKFW